MYHINQSNFEATLIKLSDEINNFYDKNIYGDAIICPGLQFCHCDSQNNEKNIFFRTKKNFFIYQEIEVKINF